MAGMATGFADDAATGQGMVVFNTGTARDDVFNIMANAGGPPHGITLNGAPNESIYKGILLFQDPTAAGGTHKEATRVNASAFHSGRGHVVTHGDDLHQSGEGPRAATISS